MSFNGGSVLLAGGGAVFAAALKAASGCGIDGAWHIALPA